jgi:K+-transporting ATPase KdpF subunit
LESESPVECGMTVVAAVVGVLLLGYLLVALIRPEKF